MPGFRRRTVRPRASEDRVGVRLQRQAVKEPDGAHPRQQRMKPVAAPPPDAQVQIDLRRRQKVHHAKCAGRASRPAATLAAPAAIATPPRLRDWRARAADHLTDTRAARTPTRGASARAAPAASHPRAPSNLSAQTTGVTSSRSGEMSLLLKP